jgi:hypothetical protein
MFGGRLPLRTRAASSSEPHRWRRRDSRCLGNRSIRDRRPSAPDSAHGCRRRARPRRPRPDGGAARRACSQRRLGHPYWRARRTSLPMSALACSVTAPAAVTEPPQADALSARATATGDLAQVVGRVTHAKTPPIDLRFRQSRTNGGDGGCVATAICHVVMSAARMVDPVRAGAHLAELDVHEFVDERVVFGQVEEVAAQQPVQGDREPSRTRGREGSDEPACYRQSTASAEH